MEQPAHPEIEHTKRPEMERGKYPPNVLVLCPTSLGTPLHNSGSSTFGILARFYPLLRRIDNRRRLAVPEKALRDRLPLRNQNWPESLRGGTTTTRRPNNRASME